jgi:hypothetical protein
MTSAMTSLSTEYADLSHAQAARGDLRLAQLAAWAGDVHVLEELLWESGLGDAPDAAAELATVGESVAAAVEDLAHALPGAPLTARAVVEAAREALVTTFDESVHGLLADRFAELSVLDDAHPRPGTDRGSRVASRLDGRTAAGLEAELRVAAGDCATMAGLLAGSGEPEAAGRLSRQADAAAFEAYLVGAAIRAGDEALVTVDLRWELAAEVAPGTDRRDRFASVVGSAERDRLHQVLEPVYGA